MTAAVVQTGVISVLPLTTLMRNFVVEGKLRTFVLYYIEEKTVCLCYDCQNSNKLHYDKLHLINNILIPFGFFLKV